MTIEELIKILNGKIKEIEEEEEIETEYSEIISKNFLFKDGRVDVSVDSELDMYAIFIMMLREKYDEFESLPLLKKSPSDSDLEKADEEIVKNNYDMVTLLYAMARNIASKKFETVSDILKVDSGIILRDSGLVPSSTRIDDVEITLSDWFEYRGYNDIKAISLLIESLSTKMDYTDKVYKLIQKITGERLDFLDMTELERQECVRHKSPYYKHINEVIKGYYYGVERLEKKKKLNLRKEKIKYLEAKEKLLEESEKEVITNLSFVSEISDEKLQELVLKYIYDHNKAVSDNLERELIQARSNSIVVYQHVLAETGIILTEELYQKISFRTKEEIEQIIAQAKNYGITNSNSILQMLMTANIESLSNIAQLYENGILSKKFISSDPELFDSGSHIYENLMCCLKTLKDRDIPCKVLYNNYDILALNSKQLNSSLDCIDEYGLTKSIKKGTNIKFLSEEGLEDLMDLVIEYGYSQELYQDLSILNYSKERWLRLSILKELNELPKNIDELKEVLDEPNFIVPDHKINEYVSLPSDEYKTIMIDLLQEEDLEKFEKRTKDSLTYDFGGILISRKKVERALKNPGKKDSTATNTYKKDKK